MLSTKWIIVYGNKRSAFSDKADAIAYYKEKAAERKDVEAFMEVTTVKTDKLEWENI